MEKADTTKFCNERSKHYNNFVKEEYDNLIYKDSRFCSEGRLLVYMIDSYYVIDHEPHKRHLLGTSNPHQQTNLSILNHHPRDHQPPSPPPLPCIVQLPQQTVHLPTSTLPSLGYSIWNPWNGGWRLMDSMDFPDGFHIIPWNFQIIPWNFQIIPWNFQMDSILFKSDLMPPQNSIQNSYVNIDIVFIIFT